MGKLIKDPVHGYIEIDSEFINIINSVEFQRLKFIEQGSFRVLYPAARHDRFVHSLGVYHLSKIISKCFLDNIRNDLEWEKDFDFSKEEKTFHYAALLHDVGHAPFSHTTEDFFKQATYNDEMKIRVDLQNEVEAYIKLINKKNPQEQIDKFISDFEKTKPAPHEIVSATLLIQLADKYLNKGIKNYDMELAARMVIGCTYSLNTRKSDFRKFGIRNCFIRLLNSDTVDVDKLDYIKRDTFMTGFNNVDIDVTRIAKSVTAIQLSDNQIFPAYRKSSLSVIDNVFKAKQEQGNWIISHPSVTYESALMTNCISGLWSSRTIEKIFSIDSLSQNGHQINGKVVRLLNDSDIIPLLKEKANFIDKNIYGEIFDRSLRRKPVWKSKAEYKVLFDDNNDVFQFFKPLITWLIENKVFVIDDTIFNQVKGKQEISCCKLLKEIADSLKICFSFVIIHPKSSFAPSFNPDRVYISFGKVKGETNSNFVPYSFIRGKVDNNNEKNYFYIYTKENVNVRIISEFKKRILNATKPRA